MGSVKYLDIKICDISSSPIFFVGLNGMPLGPAKVEPLTS